MIKIYGISNCDATINALHWFKENNIEVKFHDYKKSGITLNKLLTWCKQKDWKLLLNRRSSTWKGLSSRDREKVTNPMNAIQLMLKNNIIIKRPIIEYEDKILMGFNESTYQQTFKNIIYET